MRADDNLRWQVRLRSRADLDLVKELTGVLAVLSGLPHGQVIAEAVKAYALAHPGERAVEVLDDVAANLRRGSAPAVVGDAVNMCSTCPSGERVKCIIE